MNSLPIQYLHLETMVLPVFLAMVLWMQLARARDPGHFTQSGRKQLVGLLTLFAVLTAGFGSFLYTVSPLLAVELAAGFTLSLLHPVNALCFFAHLLFLRPWEIVVDNALLLALPRFLALTCFVSWLLHPEFHAKPARQTIQVSALLLGFSLWLFVSTFKAPQAAEVQVEWFNTYFKSLIVFAMCLFFIESKRSIVQFEWTLVISTLALMLIGFYQFRLAVTSLGRLETVGMLSNPNDLAAIITMALPFALVPVFSRTANLGQQSACILFSLFSIGVIWLTKSRGALLALVMQALTLRLLQGFRQRWFTILLLAGVLATGYVIALKVIPRSAEEMTASQESRLTYMKVAIKMTLHHPLFGVGFNQYPEQYQTFVSGTVHEWGKRAAHSSWFLAFAESGIPGGLLCLSFFWAVLRTAWRNRQRWPAQLYALVGYGVAMSFLSHTYLIYPYLLAGLVLASHSLKERFPDEQ